MYFLYLVPFYVKWHYTEGFEDLYRNWKNFILFTLYFFSLGLLFRTWFSPLGRLNEEYKKGLDLEAFSETLVVNIVMRVVGFILRTVVIIFGLLALITVVLLGPILLILWAFLPFIVLALLIESLINLF